MKNLISLTSIEKENRECKEEIKKRIDKVIESNKFILGEEVKEFEKHWASNCKTKYATGVSNGTDALYLALCALNIGSGDEVITVPNTFIATTEAISKTGADIKFVDIKEDTLLMNLESLEEKVSEKTRAVIPVHLHGQMVNMPRLNYIAKKHKLYVIEDAAQAHLSMYHHFSPGILSDIACFSFFPGKNLGAFGDAGAIVTNHLKINEAIQKLRNHGRSAKHIHLNEGWNCRMDEIQAAVLNAKLPFLEQRTEKRKLNVKKYLKLLPKEVSPLKTDRRANPVYHHFVILSKKRDEIHKFLKEYDIETGIHYPIPLHRQPAYEHLSLKEGSFPITEKTANEKLSLPLFSYEMKWEIEHICNKIKQFYGG